MPEIQAQCCREPVVRHGNFTGKRELQNLRNNIVKCGIDDDNGGFCLELDIKLIKVAVSSLQVFIWMVKPHTQYKFGRLKVAPSSFHLDG
nr:hypothetical protein Iba_chr05cCG9170 [Ipomoea batatas]